MAANKPPMIAFDTRGSITVGRVTTSCILNSTNVLVFGEEVLGYIREHPGLHLLLDFGNVTYLSSAALTELLRINEACRERQGSVRLCGLSDDILKVFKITNLDKLFVIHRDDKVEKAVNRFQRSLDVSAEDDAWPALED